MVKLQDINIHHNKTIIKAIQIIIILAIQIIIIIPIQHIIQVVIHNQATLISIRHLKVAILNLQLHNMPPMF